MTSLGVNTVMIDISILAMTIVLCKHGAVFLALVPSVLDNMDISGRLGTTESVSFKILCFPCGEASYQDCDN